MVGDGIEDTFPDATGKVFGTLVGVSYLLPTSVSSVWFWEFGNAVGTLDGCSFLIT